MFFLVAVSQQEKGAGQWQCRNHENAAFKFATWEKIVSFAVLAGTVNIIDKEKVQKVIFMN